MSHKDWRGKEIKVGCSILYPVVHSTTVELVEAVVEEITDIEYKTNFGNKKRTFELKVVPYGRLLSGRTTWERDKKPKKIIAVERVTVIETS